MPRKQLIGNLAARNIAAISVSTVEAARAKVLQLIPYDAVVGSGNSRTLKDMDIFAALVARGQQVYDKTLAQDSGEKKELAKKALLADWFLAGTNALSEQGHLVNIDHSGNRVAAMLYGPDHVLLVAGKNKIAPDLAGAIRRAKNEAAPKNARRAGYNPPCVALGKCVDCSGPQRVCNSLTIIHGQADPQRMTVIIVEEDLGF